ncbi:MAG: LysR family transcriptional regulator [Bacteriovoracaceae bacterium]|nr:LysR family transcriptional regulator [Bacteriovoracaceae bacterium]
MDFDLNKLKVFYYVYQTKSPTKAAKKLYITQSGVSQHIKALEQRIGATLFSRDKKLLRPTSIGHELYKTTQEYFATLENFAQNLRNIDGAVKATIKIGTPSGFSIAMISKLVAEFQKNYPDITFIIEHGNPQELEAMLLEDNLDFAFTDPYVTFSNDIKQVPVFCEHVALIGPPNHFKDYKDQNELFDQLVVEKFIVYKEDAPITKSWFKFHFDKIPKSLVIAARVLQTPTIIQMVKMGVGVAIVPRYLVDNCVAKKELCYLETKAQLANTINLTYREKNHSLRIVEICREFFINYLKSFPER